MQLPQLAAILLLALLAGGGHSQASKRRVMVCLQPAQSGRCFGYVKSYAYDPFAGRCEEFIYGGCGGNDNRFDTKTDCERTCRDV